MNPVDLGRATRNVVHDVPSSFMVDAATYRRGGEAGFEGVDFYVAGRGGALGDVHASVVAAAFVFFNPDTIAEAWHRSGGVMPRREAAELFAECGYAWARENLRDDVDTANLAEVLGKVVASASPAGAPMFAAWRELPVPTDAPAACLNRLNAMRELRAAYHGGAVLAAGLLPLEAMAVKSPHMAALFGWTERLPDAGLLADRWQAAEEATDVAVGRVLEVLDDAEQEVLVSACAAVHPGGR